MSSNDPDKYLSFFGKAFIEVSLKENLQPEIVSHPLKYRYIKAGIIKGAIHDYLQGRIPVLEINRSPQLPMFIPLPWACFLEGQP